MGVRIVGCVSTRDAGGRGPVTYIVPYSAVPLDPLMCVLTPREFRPPSQLLYCVGLSILTAVSL